MGSITRNLTLTGVPDVDSLFIGYSRLLLANPFDYNSALCDTLGCPMVKGNYENIESGIEGATADNTYGNNGDGFWEITFNANSWDIDSVGGVRVGDFLVTSQITGPLSGYATITKVQRTTTTLTLTTDSVGNTGTDTSGVSLAPVGRGNFGPVRITITNIGTGLNYVTNYQPPTTTAVDSAGSNYFIVDASEPLKTALAKYQGQPVSDGLAEYRCSILIELLLDGSVADDWTTNNGLAGVELPVGVGYPKAMSGQVYGTFFTLPTWSIRSGGIPVLGTTIDSEGVINTQTSTGGTEIDCVTADFLSIDGNYLGLVWLNNYGAFDVFFFPYGEGGQYGGTAPVHTYNAGKSILARRDFDITQVSAGVQTQSWQFNTGMMPVEWVGFFQGLMASILVYAIPPDQTISVNDFGQFELRDQTGLQRVYLSDADWEDSVYGEPKTRFSATATVAKIIKGRLL